MRLTFLPILALAVLLAACRQPPAPPASPPVPEPPGPPAAMQPATAPPALPGVVENTAQVPRLVAPTVGGGLFDLATHRGHWVVVNFWATWCAPCLKEMPELSALHAMREQVQVVGLAYEDIGLEEMRAFLEQHPVAYPIVIVDPMDPPQDFATPRGLPVTYLLAPDGTVARQFLGPVTAHELETAIAASGGQVR